MSYLKIAFIGMGSIGKRHLLNFIKLLNLNNIIYSIDLFRSNINKNLDEDILKQINNQYEISKPITERYDVIFITNPTSLHYQTLRNFFSYGESFFIEKPVFHDSGIDYKSIGDFSNKIVYVACPLRYNPVIQYLKNNVNISDVISVRAISSSYLPEWRPGIDYRNCYSSHKDLGGGVAIDLIHEWDYLSYIFGVPKRGFALINKFSSLDIDSDDKATYIAESDTISFELHLDYFGRKTIREIDIFTNDDTIRCDIINGNVKYLKEGKDIRFNFDRNEYQILELEHFLDIIQGKSENDSSIEHAIRVLKFAKGDFR